MRICVIKVTSTTWLMTSPFQLPNRLWLKLDTVRSPQVSSQEYIYLMPGAANASRGSEQYFPGAPYAIELHVDIWDSDAHRLLSMPNLFSVNRTKTHEWKGLAFPALTDEDAFLLQVVHACAPLFTYWIKMSSFLELGFFL